MYRAPSKRRQIIQRTIVYAFMTMMVIGLVTVAVLLMLGFRFNRDSNAIQQGGLVQFSSRPSDARIKLGNASLADLTSAKITANPGDYPVTMKRDGYLPWQKDITVKAGEILWLNYAQLVPERITTNKVRTYSRLDQTLTSPNGRYIAIIDNDRRLEIDLLKIDNATTSQSQIVLPKELAAPQASSRFSIVSWSDDNERMLVKQTAKKSTTWYVIDRSNPERSFNVTKDYDIDVADASFDPRDSRRLFIRTPKGEVRLLDSTAKSLSAVLLHGITKTSLLNNSTMLYIQKNNAGKSLVGYLTLDAPVGRELPQLSNGTVTNVAGGTYFGDIYIATTTASTLQLHTVDSLPDSDSERPLSITKRSTQTMLNPVTELSIRSGGRFVIAQARSSFSNYDIELKKFTTVSLGKKKVETLKWLDRYHAYYIQNGQLQVLEFDGANRRGIVTADSRFDAVQSSDAKYIYSFKQAQDGIELQRTQMILD